MSWFLRGLIGLAVLLIAGIAGGLAWLRTSIPEWSGTAVVDGLESSVAVVRDANGFPHIFANSRADGAFALGYVHAQDRLYQMEMMRRLGAGRLAEVAGKDALPVDRFYRTLGLYRLAESSLAAMAPEGRRLLDAYAAGVNAYLDGHKGAWPPEFYLLGIDPEPWRPADSLVWGRLMALRLSGNWRTEILRARLARRLDPAAVERLWPDAGGGTPATLGPESARAFRWPGGLPLADLAAALPAAARGASNEWVLSGRRTATGKPILANDPHLGFSMPGLWYLARLVTPDGTLAGATVPGVPIFVLGRNDRIAWGFTTTNSDTADLFIETLDPSDDGRYLTPDGPRPFRIRTEEIRIRGGDVETLTIRETRHGPVVSDLSEATRKALGPGRVAALQATFLRPDDRTAEALFGINLATDWDGFLAALRLFHSPQQNIVYADTSGRIGFVAPARVPIRRGGDGRVPSPGESGAGDWIGEIPFDDLPRRVDPPDGLFVNANNRIGPPGYPYFLGRDWDAPYRARRILQLLDGGAPATLASTEAIQRDIVSLMARELLPLMARIEPADARSAEALRRLAAWDGAMDRRRAEPLVFAAWLRETNRRLFEDDLGEDFEDFWDLRPLLVRSVLVGDGAWCDDRATADRVETCPEILAGALADALAWIAARFGDDMDAWRWGAVHEAEFRHRLFGRLPLIGDLANVHLPSDGGAFTVNRGAFFVADREAPFAHRHGAGFRAVYDLADLDRSRFSVATGPCGNPLCPDYGTFPERWRDFESFTLAGSREALAAAGRGTLTLRPR